MPGLGGKIALLASKAEARECVLLCLAGRGLRWGSLARSREVACCVGNAKTERLPPRALGQLSGPSQEMPQLLPQIKVTFIRTRDGICRSWVLQGLLWVASPVVGAGAGRRAKGRVRTDQPL